MLYDSYNTWKKGNCSRAVLLGELTYIFSSFVHDHFASMVKKCPNPKQKLFLHNGNLPKNSCKAWSALDKMGAQKFSIPTCSPNLNQVEYCREKDLASRCLGNKD